MQTTKLLPINFIHIFIDKRLTPAYNSFVLKKINYALVAQLDRALVYGTKGWGFELLQAHHKSGGSSTFCLEEREFCNLLASRVTNIRTPLNPPNKSGGSSTFRLKYKE